MPIKRCSKNGKSGWKWGDSGICYTGSDGKKKAAKQGYAIDKNKFKQEMASLIDGDDSIQSLVSKVLAEDSVFEAMKWNLEIAERNTKTININANSAREAMKTAEASNPKYRATSATPKSKDSHVYEVVLVRK